MSTKPLSFEEQLALLAGEEPPKKEFAFEYRGSEARKALAKASDYYFFANGVDPNSGNPTYTFCSLQRYQEAGVPDADNFIFDEIQHFLPNKFDEVEPSVFEYEDKDQFGINALIAVGMNQLATKPPNWP